MPKIKAKKKKVIKKKIVKECEKDIVKNKDDKVYDDEKKMQKTDVFEMFCVWSTMPISWKGKSEEKLIKAGINDEEIMELLSCVSLKDFAKHFNVHINTLTKWKKKQRARDHLADARIWLQRMSGNVLGALYREATGSNIAPGIFKEYFKTVHHVGERVDISVPEELREAINKINELLPN